jgi:hypothetical protein
MKFLLLVEESIGLKQEVGKYILGFGRNWIFG